MSFLNRKPPKLREEATKRFKEKRDEKDMKRKEAVKDIISKEK